MRCNRDVPPSSDPATWAEFAQLLVMLAIPTAVLLIVRYLNLREVSFESDPDGHLARAPRPERF